MLPVWSSGRLSVAAGGQGLPSHLPWDDGRLRLLPGDPDGCRAVLCGEDQRQVRWQRSGSLGALQPLQRWRHLGLSIWQVRLHGRLWSQRSNSGNKNCQTFNFKSGNIYVCTYAPKTVHFTTVTCLLNAQILQQDYCTSTVERIFCKEKSFAGIRNSNTWPSNPCLLA